MKSDGPDGELLAFFALVAGLCLLFLFVWHYLNGGFAP